MTWTTLAAAVTFWCIGAAWGAGVSRRADDDRYARLVAQIANVRSVVRDLYRAEDYADPDFYDESEPEPDEQPRWWGRAWAWIAGPEVARIKGQAEAFEEVATMLEAEQQNEPEPNFVHDPEPKTAPIVLPSPTGPPTQPAQAVIADDWKRESDALYERMMAEIRGQK